MPTSTRGRDPAREEEFLGALYKGGELLAAGNIVEAREHLEKAHGLEPKNEKAQNLLGLTYFKLGLLDQASEVYEKLVNENPADATLRVNLGLVYLKTNNLERCIHEFETATDLEPTHKKAHNYLGLALAQQGNYVKAKDHFELAGSDQMAEKMGRAIAAQTTPSGSHSAVAKQAPKTVVLGGEEEKPAPPIAAEPSKADDDTIEVMSDEELPSDVYVVPEDVQAASPPPEAANLNDDWGAQLGGPQDPPVEEMRFAEDEGPAEELPVLEAEVVSEAVPPPAPSAPPPAWLTMEAAEAARVDDSQTQWVTESVADVPPPDDSVPAAVVEDIAAGVSSEANGADAAWATGVETPMEEVPVTVEPLPMPEDTWAAASENAAPATAEPAGLSAEDPAWAAGGAEATVQVSADLYAEAAQAEPTADDSSWATGSTDGYAATTPATDDAQATDAYAAPAQTTDDAAWATGNADSGAQAADAYAATPQTTDDASWATGNTDSGVQPTDTYATTPQSADDAAWATGNADGAHTADAHAAATQAPDDASWATGASDGSGQTADAYAATPQTPDDASWATGASDGSGQTADAYAATPQTPDDASWATDGAGQTADAYAAATQTPDDASWATGSTDAPQPEAQVATTPDDDSWATGSASHAPTTADDAAWNPPPAAVAPVTDDALLGAPAADAAWSSPTQMQWATEQVQGVPTPLPQTMPEVAVETSATPEPSAPLPITVEEPADAPPPMDAPAGYTPMAPQRLVDLGASGAWVHDASTGPFHLSTDGLAVTVNGEMLLRMNGLVAVVGSVQVAPELRRRRGRPTSEPFGDGPTQLQRVSGHGVIYLEPGRAKFHAVDLTDHNGVKVDDDGAYIREEYVFAFEEPISFENGRLTSDAQLLELVHLKGTGRVLLQLDGSLRAMPIPVAAPLVVPLHRVVGWFGRVTPRITGFGGRGAIELTGEGYALLGAPPERS